MDTLLATTPDNAVLVAFLGRNPSPEGYWPTADHDAFKAALAEYGLAYLNLVDDRDDPLPADHDDAHLSLAAYLDSLRFQDA